MEHNDDIKPETEEPILATKWAHGATTIYKKATHAPPAQSPKTKVQISSIPHPPSTTLVDTEDEYDSSQGSGPTNKKASRNQQLVVIVIAAGVVLACSVGLFTLLSQPSLADKQCQDQLGTGGVWVDQMKQCGCATGYTESYGDACIPN